MLLKQTKGFISLDALTQEPAIELYDNLFLTGGVLLDTDILPSELFNSLSCRSMSGGRCCASPRVRCAAG